MFFLFSIKPNTPIKNSNIEKYYFAMSKIKVLRYIINKNGIFLEPKKVKIIKNLFLLRI